MSVDFNQVPSPCYVLEEELLIKNLEKLNEVQQQAGVDIILAFKGFAMWSAFPLVRKHLKGATASSLNEVRLCFEEMQTKAHTYMVAYKEGEFDEIAQKSSHITFNSISQFERFHKQAKEKGVSVGIRINPEYSEVETDLYNPSSPTSRLGMTAGHFVSGLPSGVEGLHFHVLCESSSYALENTLQEVERKFGHLLHQVKWLNLGGGHLITRSDYDVQHLIKTLKEFQSKYDLQLILEPGSAIAWETGYLVAEVLDIVENTKVKTAILDVSFTCHMPDCLEMPYKPTILGADKETKSEEGYNYRMGGLSCLAGDFMEEYTFSEPLQMGQKIVFNDMIHYTMVKTSTFNGIGHPSIGIWRSDSGFELIRTFGYEDFKNRLS